MRTEIRVNGNHVRREQGYWLTFKGYVGICYRSSMNNYYGDVVGLRDVVTFTGRTKALAIKAFQDSVNDYLAFCKERGEKPEKLERW